MRTATESEHGLLPPIARDLETRHLLVVAEAEEKGHAGIVWFAHRLWSIHSAGIRLLEYLLRRRS